MICLTCKKQIPDDIDRCPNCGTEVFHKQQLGREISFRRYQRWIFYVIFILVFVGMLGIVVKIYNINNKLLLQVSGVQQDLTSKTTELQNTKSDLDKTTQQLTQVQQTLQGDKNKLSGDLTTSQKQLADKITELQTTVNDKLQISADYSRVSSYLTNISLAATGITNADLDKIQVADVAYNGVDTDGDGLPDDMEAALGTSATSTDTDSDGYNDKAEIVSGFDPLKAGAKMPIDQIFANKQKGRIFKQVWNGGYLWYVGNDGKRYFLGKFE